MAVGTRLVSTVVLCTASALCGLLWMWRRRRRRWDAGCCEVKRWRPVGTLVDLLCYPVKSCGPLRVDSGMCQPLGLVVGAAKDRSFMVVKADGRFLTARVLPSLLSVGVHMDGHTMVLTAPHSPPLRVHGRDLQRGARTRVRMWDNTLEVVDCGEATASWLAAALPAGAGMQPRLVYYPRDESTRRVRANDRVFRRLRDGDLGAFPDVTSYNLINEASVDELNGRMSRPVTPLHFRPNLVVAGAQAFDEDGWRWLRIGDAAFENVRPCTRCVLTTLDPETGIKDSNGEPLTTLKKYRQVTDPKIRVAVNDSPMMGIHLTLVAAGEVRVGDTVYVGEA